MNPIAFEMKRIVSVCLLLPMILFMGCSSTPESQPEPSKKEVQQDADRFFEKMKQEESQSSYPQ